MFTSAPTWLKTGAVGLAGLAAGGILATTVAATAQDSGNGDTATQGDRSPRSGEELLTGDTADQVREAALAEHPGATVLRLETDSDGVYEAHLITTEGTPVTVLVDEDFEVTGEEEGDFGHHGPGGPGGPDEEPLTGDTADQVREAALAEHPGATVLRLETDSDGVYEAHLITADGTPVTVLVNEDFEVTGEEEGGFGHGSGPRDGDFGGDLPNPPSTPGTGATT